MSKIPPSQADHHQIGHLCHIGVGAAYRIALPAQPSSVIGQRGSRSLRVDVADDRTVDVKVADLSEVFKPSCIERCRSRLADRIGRPVPRMPAKPSPHMGGEHPSIGSETKLERPIAPRANGERAPSSSVEGALAGLFGQSPGSNSATFLSIGSAAPAYIAAMPTRKAVQPIASRMVALPPPQATPWSLNQDSILAQPSLATSAR